MFGATREQLADTRAELAAARRSRDDYKARFEALGEKLRGYEAAEKVAAGHLSLWRSWSKRAREAEAGLESANHRIARLSERHGSAVVVSDLGRWELRPGRDGLSYRIECRGGHILSGVIGRDALDNLVAPLAPLAPVDPVAGAVLALGDKATLAAINQHLGTRMTWREVTARPNIVKVPDTKPGVYSIAS